MDLDLYHAQDLFPFITKNLSIIYQVLLHSEYTLEDFKNKTVLDRSRSHIWLAIALGTIPTQLWYNRMQFSNALQDYRVFVPSELPPNRTSNVGSQPL